MIIPPYMDKFHPGDIAIAKEEITFSDGTKHVVNQEILITDQNKDYFNLHRSLYDKKEPK